MPTDASEIFKSSSQNLTNLFVSIHRGFRLPAYQRPYSWDAGDVSELLEDVLHGVEAMLDGNIQHFTFIGSIITVRNSPNSIYPETLDSMPPKELFTVIDGQQRLTTLLLCTISLHNIIWNEYAACFGVREKPDDKEEPVSYALASLARTVLLDLQRTFMEDQQQGEKRVYPRLIRTYQDQWSVQEKDARYGSAIAYLQAEYGEQVQKRENVNDSRPLDPPNGILEEWNNPSSGTDNVLARLSEIMISLDAAASEDNLGVAHYDVLPRLSTSSDVYAELFNSRLTEAMSAFLSSGENITEMRLARLLLISRYLLGRVAVTVVEGKNGDYAYSIFESLNTTGQPLTAFETFVPRVVESVGEASFQDSAAKAALDKVSSFLEKKDAGSERQAATEKYIINFALFEAGQKLPSRLSAQRKFMERSYERVRGSDRGREAYLTGLRDLAAFTEDVWQSRSGAAPVVFDHVLMPDDAALALQFLRGINHTVTIPTLAVYYSEATRHSNPRQDHVSDFFKVTKAVAAFSALWRAAYHGTAGIDDIYREIMSGARSQTALPPLARGLRDSAGCDNVPASVDEVRSELLARLDAGKKTLTDRDTFIDLCSRLPFEKNKKIMRFILLAAHHETIDCDEIPGLIVPSREGFNACFTLSGWNNNAHLTVEHVAPKSGGNGWDERFYDDDSIYDTIGNLVLMPKNVNSSVGNRPWDHKRTLYHALGAPSAEQAREILDSSGLNFKMSTNDIVKKSTYLPHLIALGRREGEWDLGFVNLRGRQLAGLAFDRISEWLRT